MADDRDLVIAAQQGDRDALRQVLDVAIPRVYPIAFSILQSRPDAEDAIHESVIAAIERLDQLRDPSAFRAWFLRIVINKSRNLRSRAPRDVPLSSHHENVPNPKAESERYIDINNAVESLKEPHRQIIQLYYSGMNSREIADALDMPSGSVRRMLSEAYRILRDFLGPDYGYRSERYEP